MHGAVPALASSSSSQEPSCPGLAATAPAHPLDHILATPFPALQPQLRPQPVAAPHAPQPLPHASQVGWGGVGWRDVQDCVACLPGCWLQDAVHVLLRASGRGFFAPTLSAPLTSLSHLLFNRSFRLPDALQPVPRPPPQPHSQPVRAWPI